jgi:prophage regulatory protein
MNKKRILRAYEVQEKVKLSAPTLWRMEKAGTFPKRIPLGAGSVGWLENEVDEWIDAKAAKR